MRALPFALFLFAVGCGSSSSESAAAGVKSDAVAFGSVQPVLSQKCVGCHGAQNPKGGVALDTYENVMKGGHDGPIVKAGDPAGSELVAVMRGAEGHKKMPPQGPSVPADDIKRIEAWIQAGAKGS